MKNSSLEKIFQSFSDEEHIRFEDFINSPFFNKAVYVKNYYQRLREMCPGFKNIDEKKPDIFKSLYPERAYNDSTVRKLNSELLKLAEEFLITISLKDKTYLRNNTLLKELDKRKADNLFDKRLNYSYKLLEREDSQNEEYFIELHELNNTEIFFHSLRDGKKNFSKYHQSIENLDKFYIIQKLKRLTILTRVDKMYAKVIKDKKEISSFIKLVQKSSFFPLPVVQIIFNILMLNWIESEEYFYNLKKLVPLYKNKISRQELESAYIAMLNYCVAKANMGSYQFIEHELQIYKYLIEDNFLLVDNRLQAVMYKNIVFCALDAGDLKFAEDFKEEYSKYLFIPEKVHLIEFCNANIAYAKKEYAKALQTMAKINFSNVLQRFSLRNLYLKIFYENEMHEQAFLNLDSYYHTLKREKTLPADVLKLYTTFLSLYKKLLKLKLSPNKSEAFLLAGSIKRSDTVAKSWLIKMCEKLT